MSKENKQLSEPNWGKKPFVVQNPDKHPIEAIWGSDVCAATWWQSCKNILRPSRFIYGWNERLWFQLQQCEALKGFVNFDNLEIDLWNGSRLRAWNLCPGSQEMEGYTILVPGNTRKIPKNRKHCSLIDSVWTCFIKVGRTWSLGHSKCLSKGAKSFDKLGWGY